MKLDVKALLYGILEARRHFKSLCHIQEGVTLFDYELMHLASFY